MYKSYFDFEKQEEMRKEFLRLSKKGIIRYYKKNSNIRIKCENGFSIVVDGKLKQSIYSTKGEEKILYILQNGEIFGEMDYFEGGEDHLIVKAIENSKISFIDKDIIENEIMKNPIIYRYIMHSIVRKFRILMFQMADMAFEDSYGKVADTIIRMLNQEDIDRGNKVINERLTHEEIANLIGCSRVTVTKILNEFKEVGLIEINSGRISIKDVEGLNKYIKWR